MLNGNGDAQAKAASKPTVKPKATKAPVKPNAAPKKKVPIDVDENADDSILDVDDYDYGSGSSTARAAPAAANGKKKTASETYQKVRPTQ